MKKLIALFLALVGGALAQPTPAGGPPPATQAEVDAGTVANKYVSPLTLNNWSGGGGDVTLAGDNAFTGLNTFAQKITPAANDGAPLGDTTHNWSDLFLASGGVVNFANGNYTLTHSSGVLTANGSFVATTGTFGSTTSLLLGTAGSAVGNIGFRNATSGTITLAPPTGALGTVTLTIPAATDTLVAKATTDTLTNKRVTPRVVTESDATSWTPAGDTSDISYQSNSQSAGTLTINAPSGTPTNGQKLLLKIKSGTGVQTYSWNAIYVSGSDVTLPTVSTASKIDNIGFIYDSVNSKWECVAVARGY